MRNFLLSCFFLTLMQGAFAQCSSCTPNNFGCSPLGGLCNKPDTGMANHPYTTVIHFNLPKKLTDPATLSQCSGCSYVQLNKVKITGLTGLPAGADNYNFSKVLAPYKGYYNVENNDTMGCVTICGTPLAAGTYVIQVNIDADVIAKEVPVVGDVPRNDQPQKYTDTIIILPDTSGSVSSFTYGGVREDCDSVRLTLDAILSAPTPNLTRYFWSINGQASINKTPGTVTFNQPGIYPVVLKTVYYQYVLKTIHVSNATGGWCGDIEELICSTADPEIYAKVGLLGVNTSGSTSSSKTNIDVNIPAASGVMPMGTTSVSFELWDLDNGTPLGSADDKLGTWSVNVSQAFAYPYQVNFGGGNAQGYVVIDTVSSTTIVDTLKVNIKGRPIKPVPVAAIDSLCNGDSIRLVASPYCAECTYEWYRDTNYLANVSDSFYYAKESGAYRLKVTNATTGCSNMGDSVKHIYFNAMPTDTPAILYYAATNQLFMNPSISSVFKARWFKDGLEIPGQTGSLIPFLGDGDYQVIIYNPTFTACDLTTAVTNINVSGIEEQNELAQSLSIKPNPSKGLFIVSVRTLANDVAINVTDILGRPVYSASVATSNNAMEKTVDLSEFGKGVYLMNVTVNGKNVVKKVVVE